MAARDDDLDIGHLFRVIFMQGGQVAIGTAIGAGVLLLVGIVGVLLSPVLVPFFLYRYWRSERRKRAAAAGEGASLAAQEPAARASGAPPGGGEGPPAPV